MAIEFGAVAFAVLRGACGAVLLPEWGASRRKSWAAS